MNKKKDSISNVKLEPCKSRIGKATVHMYLPLAHAQKRYETSKAGGQDADGESLEARAKKQKMAA